MPAHDPSTPAHLRPSAPVAERALLPGDPHRALAVAQALLDEPKMLNHARGLWGYTGTAADGELLTVQATGMGGPSAAIVVEELIGLGVKRMVRIGTCGALGEGLPVGELLAAAKVLPLDGASAALGARTALRPDAELQARLVEAGARAATVVTTDLFYDPRGDLESEWLDRGAAAVEMEAATLLAVAKRHGVPAACVLGVTDVPQNGQVLRATVEEMEELALKLGEVGFAAVARDY